MRTKHLIAILVLLALATPASPAHAGGIVTICDEAHLRAALAGGGTVTFSCSGTITLASTIAITTNTTTIDGSGQTVTISGNNAVRVFNVYSGGTLNLNRLTVANGNSSGGGGIQNFGTVTVSNSTFSGNSAYSGGGIFNGADHTLTVTNSSFSGNSGRAIYNQGTVIVNDSTFSDNGSIGWGGGGIYNGNGGAVTVSNSTFSGNSAGEGSGGGGIFNHGYNSTVTVSNSTFSDNSGPDGGGGITNSPDGTVTVSNSTFSGNSASGGGGINNGGMLTVSNSTFSGNSASYSGGGVLNGGTLTVSNSTLSSNTASSSGGGVYNGNDGTVTVSNSTFSGNSATGYGGGGIFNYYSDTLTVTNSTFSGNSATIGGGIRNFYGTVTLSNTIVANSLVGGNCADTITDGSGNLSYPDTTCPGINSDPVLGPLQNNGGPTETRGLGSGSAALDAANDAICAAAPVNNLDQRGVTRPQGPHCDIGAVEQFCPNFVPPTTVGVEDIQAIVAFWGWTSSTPGWNPAYDLNLDNKVDIVDIMLVTAAWGRMCS